MSPSSEGDDSRASSMRPSEAGESNSLSSNGKKRKSDCGPVFKAWSFQLMVKADLCHGTSAVEKEKLLREHLSARTGNTRPLSVIGIVVFCDRSLFSQPPDNDGLVSIEVLGYVQANHAKGQSTMNRWIDTATWQPVPGGLTSDHVHMSNIRRFEDPNDEWTRLKIFGEIGANNAGRAADKAARKVGCLLDNYLLPSMFSCKGISLMEVVFPSLYCRRN